MKNKLLVMFGLMVVTSLSQSQVVIVNGIRTFSVDENTLITVDGVIGGATLFGIVGTGGYKIRFSVADDVNGTISQGTFSEVHLISDIKGPVTRLNPLEIMDQRVFTTADTRLVDLVSIASLSLNDLVSVSGTVHNDNSMQLSRMKLETSLDDWMLRGFTQNVTATNFTIGNLLVNLNGVTATNCDAGLVNAEFVKIQASADMSYIAGNPLTTLTSIECDLPDVDQDPDFSVPVVIEGFVTSIIDLASFRMNDLVVFFDEDTEFDNGEAEHLDVGTKIEVQGTYDTINGLVTADSIRFTDHRVKIIAPVSPGDIVLGTSIEILGKTVQIIPQTRDDDEVISGGIAEDRQIEVRGFADADGVVFVQRVKDRGDDDDTEVTLRGEVSTISQPGFTLLGISVDTVASMFLIDDSPVSAADFFAILEVGMQVSVDDAIYDEVSNTLSGGEVELKEEELDDSPDSTGTTTANLRQIVGTGGRGIATITTVNDQVFVDGFDSISIIRK
ncbi:MAG: DUF5666 domain-containing protein [Proteobacteria bacterium]|nr:DUF5666 domain-containing protein [Pseudomonadota bacterium]